MDDFLASALKLMNEMNPGQFEKLSAEFRTGLSNNLRLFGKHAFRKHEPESEGRSILNAALWDVMSTGLSRIPEPVVEARADRFVRAFYSLMADSSFNRAITYGPNTPARVKERFEIAIQVIAEVLGD